MHSMDEKLVAEAQRSSASPLDVELGDRLVSIIKDNGFSVNQEKVRLQRSDTRQEVTGLVVNEFVNVPRELVRQIRAMLHAWRKYGLESAHEHHVNRYYSDPSGQQVASEKEDAEEKWKGPPRFEDVLRGRIEYVGMVRGKDNPIYRKYRARYDELADEDLQAGTGSDGA
jgi:RNA-directed DNA polymerase